MWKAYASTLRGDTSIEERLQFIKWLVEDIEDELDERRGQVGTERQGGLAIDGIGSKPIPLRRRSGGQVEREKQRRMGTKQQQQQQHEERQRCGPYESGVRVRGEGEGTGQGEGLDQGGEGRGRFVRSEGVQGQRESLQVGEEARRGYEKVMLLTDKLSAEVDV